MYLYIYRNRIHSLDGMDDVAIDHFVRSEVYIHSGLSRDEVTYPLLRFLIDDYVIHEVGMKYSFFFAPKSFFY